MNYGDTLMPPYRRGGIFGILGSNPALIFVIGSLVLLLLGLINYNQQAIMLAYFLLFIGVTMQVLLPKKRR